MRKSGIQTVNTSSPQVSWATCSRIELELLLGLPLTVKPLDYTPFITTSVV